LHTPGAAALVAIGLCEPATARGGKRSRGVLLAVLVGGAGFRRGISKRLFTRSRRTAYAVVMCARPNNSNGPTEQSKHLKQARAAYLWSLVSCRRDGAGGGANLTDAGTAAQQHAI